MAHCFEQAIFIALVCEVFKIQEQASVCWFSINSCVDLCSVLDLAVNRKLHRKRQAGVVTITSSDNRFF